MKLKFIKCHPLATFERDTESNHVSYPLTACSVEDDGNIIRVNYGVKVSIPKNAVGMILPIDEIASKYSMLASNSVGFISPGDETTLHGVFTRINNVAFYRINPADVVGKLVIVAMPTIELVSVKSFRTKP